MKWEENYLEGFFFFFKEHDCKSKTERSENVSLLARFS